MNSCEVQKPIKPNKGSMAVIYINWVRATPPRYMQVVRDKIEGSQICHSSVEWRTSGLRAQSASDEWVEMNSSEEIKAQQFCPRTTIPKAKGVGPQWLRTKGSGRDAREPLKRQGIRARCRKASKMIRDSGTMPEIHRNEKGSGHDAGEPLKR